MLFAEKEQIALERIIILNQKTATTPFHLQVTKTLADFRREWQDVSQGESLVNLEVSVGLLLSDLVEKLGFDSTEKNMILGSKLDKEIRLHLSDQVQKT
ncbi:MAG: hypothetical protein H8D23_00775 [Candidatus Brocadiales bacterium]|nr:hypothetical protein [Candidatus Brocadiales bacterium]